MSNRKKKERSRRQLFTIVIVIGLLIGGVLYANELFEESGLVKVQFISSSGQKSKPYKLELADNESARQRGLMYRKEMGSDRGMLFIFPSESVQSFWMKNTYIPLDMIFINSSMQIAGILENVPVLNSEARKVDNPSRYVIELNAGEINKGGITTDWKVQFDRELPSGK